MKKTLVLLFGTLLVFTAKSQDLITVIQKGKVVNIQCKITMLTTLNIYYTEKGKEEVLAKKDVNSYYYGKGEKQINTVDTIGTFKEEKEKRLKFEIGKQRIMNGEK